MTQLAVVGSDHSCPKRHDTGIKHQGGPILKGSSNVFINDMPVARMGDPVKCKDATDVITQGHPNFLVNGKMVACKNHVTTHGGKITSGVGAVSAACDPTLIPQTMIPVAATHTDDGEHWVQGHYVNAPAGMPYSIEHSDGSVFKGTLNEEGKTDKITHLAPGTATIHFGDKEELEAQLEQQRKKLKLNFDKILEKAQIVADKRKVQLQHESDFSKGWDYTKAAAEGVGSVLVLIGKGIASLVKQCADTQDAEDTAMGDNMRAAMGQSLPSDQATLNYAQQKSIQIGKEMYGPFELANRIVSDHPSRKIVHEFCRKLFNMEPGPDKVRISSFSLVMLAGIISGNEEVLTPEVAATSELAEASTVLKKEAELIGKIENCRTKENVELDRLIVLEKEEAYNAHFLRRHGAHIPDELIQRRARTGLTPDGKKGFPVDSSKFLSSKDQLEVLETAKKEHKVTGEDRVWVTLDRDLGKIYLKGGNQSIKTKRALVRFDKNGKIYTAYPAIKMENQL